jgi:hypothetical protein
MPFRIEVANYRELQTKLKLADPALQRQFNKQMRVLSREVVAEARTAASWSTKIPPAITANAGIKGAGVRVSAKTPIAVLNERRKGRWRHPVFGNKKVWVEQKARPSVRPTVEANRLRLRILAEKAAREALREAKL